MAISRKPQGSFCEMDSHNDGNEKLQWPSVVSIKFRFATFQRLCKRLQLFFNCFWNVFNEYATLVQTFLAVTGEYEASKHPAEAG